MLSRRFLLNNTNLLYENTSKIILKNTKKDQVMSLILFVYHKLGDVISPLGLGRYIPSPCEGCKSDHCEEFSQTCQRLYEDSR